MFREIILIYKVQGKDSINADHVMLDVFHKCIPFYVFSLAGIQDYQSHNITP